MCAQKKGMTLTDEEKKTIKEDVKSARKNMTDSQKAMKGLDEATITTVKEKDKLGEKYKDSIVSTLKIDKDKLKKSVDKNLIVSILCSIIHLPRQKPAVIIRQRIKMQRHLNRVRKI